MSPESSGPTGLFEVGGSEMSSSRGNRSAGIAASTVRLRQWIAGRQPRRSAPLMVAARAGDVGSASSMFDMMAERKVGDPSAFGAWPVHNASGFRLPASGFRLPASGFRLPTSGSRLPARVTTRLPCPDRTTPRSRAVSGRPAHRAELPHELRGAENRRGLECRPARSDHAVAVLFVMPAVRSARRQDEARCLGRRRHGGRGYRDGRLAPPIRGLLRPRTGVEAEPLVLRAHPGGFVGLAVRHVDDVLRPAPHLGRR